MVRSLHRVLVLMHMITAFGWLALSAAVLLLTIHGLGVEDPTARHSVFAAAAHLDDELLADSSFMTVYTGVMLAGLTPWGYTRFWWVGVKLVLALACALLGRAAFGRWLAEAATAAQPVPGGALISGSALTIIAIAFMAWAARTKPWGRIGRNRASPRPWSPPALWVLAIVTPVADYLTGLPLQAVPVTIVLGHHARRSFSTGSRSPSVVHPNPATGEGAEVVVDPSSTPAPSSPPSCAARIDHPAKRRRAQ